MFYNSALVSSGHKKRHGVVMMTMMVQPIKSRAKKTAIKLRKTVLVNSDEIHEDRYIAVPG
jgi:hypothetical protein